jgi:site-specific DNA-methyltransferase (adenine-specific)
LGTALKPAMELICMARKPLVGTFAANVLAHGTGAINIDACRVGSEGATKRSEQAAYPLNSDGTEDRTQSWARTGHAIESLDLGRWPANLLHDGSPEVVALFPQSASGHWPEARGSGGISTGGHSGQDGLEGRKANEGSAARFFWCPKTSVADRNDGLHGLPETIVSVWVGDEDDLTAGKKSTRPRANTHPTVKPTELMRYLCRLVTPPGGIVLDPFMGSGSTLKAAELEGFNAIGIELDPAYVEIAKRRIGSDCPLFADVVA